MNCPKQDHPSRTIAEAYSEWKQHQPADPVHESKLSGSRTVTESAEDRECCQDYRPAGVGAVVFQSVTQVVTVCLRFKSLIGPHALC